MFLPQTAYLHCWKEILYCPFTHVSFKYCHELESTTCALSNRGSMRFCTAFSTLSTYWVGEASCDLHTHTHTKRQKQKTTKWPCHSETWYENNNLKIFKKTNINTSIHFFCKWEDWKFLILVGGIRGNPYQIWYLLTLQSKSLP